MLLLFWRGLPAALPAQPATATADAPAAAFVAVRQAVFGAQVATATATAAAPPSFGGFGTLDAPTAPTTASAPVGALVSVVPVGPPLLVPAGAANFTATNAATLSIPLPTGWQPDDIHVLWAHRSDNTAMTALSGWTQVAALSGNNTTAQRVEVWIRRAQAGDPNPVVVTFGSSTVVRGGKIVGVRGCPTTGLATDQVDAQARSSNATADLTIEFPAVTTTDVNRFLLLLAAFEDDPTTATTPTGFTAPADSNDGSNLGNDMALLYWHRPVLTAQTVTPAASTVSGGGVGSSPSVGIGIAFKGLLVPAGSATLPGGTGSGTAAATPTVFYAEQAAVALLGGIAPATALSGQATPLGGAVVPAATATTTASGATAGLLAGGVLAAQPTTATASAPTSAFVAVRTAALAGQVATGVAAAPTAALAVYGTLPAQPALVSATAHVGALHVVVTPGPPAVLLVAPTAMATTTALVGALVQTGGVQLVAPVSTATAASFAAALPAGALLVGATATATASAPTPALSGVALIDAPTATATALAPVAAYVPVVALLAQTATSTTLASPPALTGVVALLANTATATATMAQATIGIVSAALVGQPATAAAAALVAAVGRPGLLGAPLATATASAADPTFVAATSALLPAGHAPASSGALDPAFVATAQALILANTAPSGAAAFPMTFVYVAIVSADLAQATAAADSTAFRSDVNLLAEIAPADAVALLALFVAPALLDAPTAEATAYARQGWLVGLYATVVLSMTAARHGTATLEPTSYGVVALTVTGLTTTGQEPAALTISRDPR